MKMVVAPDAEEGVTNEQKQKVAEESTRNSANIIYGIDDIPPWYLCLFMALQHYLTMIGAIVAIPFILTPALCMAEDDPSRGHIISTMIFVTGLVTFFQVTFGCRLPIVQGGTISFLVPTLAILNLPMWRCPDTDTLAAMSADNRTELWQVRMRELSGAIAVSALLQVAIGYLGELFCHAIPQEIWFRYPHNVYALAVWSHSCVALLHVAIG